METVVSKRFLFLVVSAVLALPPLTAARTIRIVQTNAAGDNIHLIDPATNTTVGDPVPVDITPGSLAAGEGAAWSASYETGVVKRVELPTP